MNEKWAEILLEDYDAIRPNRVFSQNSDIDLDLAYKIQSEVSRLRVLRGDKLIGYKVGCVSDVTRKQMGVDHSVTGRLYENEVHQTNCHLSIKQFCNLGIEGELAIELSKTPGEEDFFENKISKCVKKVFPVIEIHNITFSEEKTPSMKIYFDDQLIEDHKGMSFISIINTSLK